MDMLVKAEAPGFIWLIVGIFWVVAQIAGAAARKNQRRPVDSGRDDSSEPPVDPFAELIRKLSDTPRFEVPQPEYDELPEEPEPAPAFVPQNAWQQGEIENRPDLEPLRQEPVQPPAPVAAPPKLDILPKMSAFRNTLPAMRLPVMALSFQPLEKSGGNSPRLGTIVKPGNQQALRRAMLSHIVFSPPKALERMK